MPPRKRLSGAAAAAHEAKRARVQKASAAAAPGGSSAGSVRGETPGPAPSSHLPEPDHAGPELEFQDPMRQSLIEEIERHANPPGESNFAITTNVWAALWLSDIDKLQILRGTKQPHVTTLLRTDLLGQEVLKRWNQRKRASSPKSSPGHSARQSRVSSLRDEQVADDIERLESTPTSHPRLRRSELQRTLCKSRDNTRCVVTQRPEIVQAAHIYPYSMVSLTKGSIVWAVLQIFWSDERIEQWKTAVFTEKGTEVCHNLITLSPEVRACWERALFALKPLDVAEDQKTMRVQFFWLRNYPSRPAQSIAARPKLPASLDGTLADSRFFDCKTKEEIVSGTILTLQTDDPETKPLPSIAFLEMQWFQHRVTALSGGADFYLSGFDRRDDSSDAFFDSDESLYSEGDW